MFFMMSVSMPINGYSQASDQSQVADRLIDLKKCISFLEKTGKLVRVKSEVDPKYELAGIAKKYEGGKCVLLEKVKRSSFPVFIGLLWNRDKIGSIFNVPHEQVQNIMADAYNKWKTDKNTLPSRILDKGPSNEVTITRNINLYDLPVPTHALKDGGPYFDASVMMVNDPQTGIPNISIREIQVVGKDQLVLAIDPGQGRHLEAYLEIKGKHRESLDVTINNGVGLAPWLASTFSKTGPGKAAIANHMVGRPIDLVKSQTVSVPAFANAQFVIEGKILTQSQPSSGPFGEADGYYSQRGKRMRFLVEVTAITHQKDPVFHSLLTGQEVWNILGPRHEWTIMNIVKQKVPDIRAAYAPPNGYEAVIQLEKSKEGVQNEAIEETFKTIRSLMWVVAVDTDVDIYDSADVAWAIATRFNAKKGLLLLKNEKGFYTHPVVRLENNSVTKVGIDATAPYPRTREFERVRFKKVDLKNYVIKE